MSALLGNSAAAICFAVVVGFVPLAHRGEPADPPDQQLKWVIGDIKRPLRGQGKNVKDKPITEENYRQIIDGLKTNLHCNGLRVHIDPDIKDPANYPKVYRAVIDYAKEQKLAIYANPIDTAELRKEKFGENRTAFADWVVKYANYFRPEFLGPFNESGWPPGEM